MNILGVSFGEIASAALLSDGRIVSAAQEERFRRIKNVGGFPLHAIEYCLREAGLDLDDIDHVAVPDLTDFGVEYSLVNRRSAFSVRDYVREAREYWYPILYQGKSPRYLEVFREKLDPEVWPRAFFDYWMETYADRRPSTEAEWQALRRRAFTSYFPGFDERRIAFYRHHLCHATHAYFTSPFCQRPQATLVCTADSFGDYENGMVAEFTPTTVKVIHTVDNHNLGRLYRNITLLLGMKPYEHEYKVMGLAPYAPSWLREQARGVFDETLQNDGINFAYRIRPPDSYFYFQDKLEGIRFDGVAGGLQDFFEDRLFNWVRNCCQQYGYRQLALGGGLALNIKANQRLAAADFVDEFFAAPAADDSSNPIGACQLAHLAMCATPPERVETMFLGEAIQWDSSHDYLRHRYSSHAYEVRAAVSPDTVAALLADGLVIGRCDGRMEFGERALGNRSILADPRDVRIVERINRIIKQRDFWMPFAPVIMEERASDYLMPSRAIDCAFMTVAFDSTEECRRCLPAAIHPADKTTRPQILRRSVSPEFHDLVRAFEQRTGVGALLNTSFNLHGHPIVRTVEDAASVFDSSEMDALLCGDTLVVKRRAQS